MNATHVLDRLQKVFNVTTDTALASKMGLKRATLGAWRTRNSMPYAECISVAKSRNVSLDWLLTGEGEMYKSASPSPVEHDELVFIPEYDICLSAGFGQYPEDHALAVGNRPFSSKWLSKKGLKAKDLQLVRVAGDSMEPLLKDKDLIMLDTSKTTPSEAMPFAVRLNDELLVKTVQNQGGGNIALVSRNKAYNDITINQHNPPDDFQIIGAVVWHAHSWI